MTTSLRKTIAMAAAYALALQGLLAFSVVAAHIARAADRPAFMLCGGAGDHEGLPGNEQTHCLQLCSAVANAAGCEPGAHGRVANVASVGASLSIAVAEALRPVAARLAANRPRAPPA
jgi:hypothetical protein